MTSVIAFGDRLAEAVERKRSQLLVGLDPMPELLPVELAGEAGLECRIAVCVVDREEGGVDALARRGARLVPLFRAGDLLAAQKTAAKPHG